MKSIKLLAVASVIFIAVASHAQVACPAGVVHCSLVTITPPTAGSIPASYNVWRTLTNGGCASTSLATCSKVGSTTITTYIDSPLAASTQYCYVATAVNGSGESNPSLQSCATTGADPAPNAPAGLTVVAK